MKTDHGRSIGITIALLLFTGILSASVSAMDRIGGNVVGGGKPIAQAEITAWVAGTGMPHKLATTQSNEEGSFDLTWDGDNKRDGVLYLVARAPNPSITMMAALGTAPDTRITINELTTVASVWTGAQFLNDSALSGNALGLRIAAGNVPNLVNLETGGLGPVIQDPLNSSQTTTLAKFNTLSNLLSACVTGLPDACKGLFELATPPGGHAPEDTLTAMQNIARHPSHQAQKLFGLFETLYPLPAGRRWRAVPYIPYLNFAPSAWTLSLVYAGGGLNSLGGIAIDGEGNLWADDNFLVGAQSTIFDSFGGGLSKIAPDGKPLSPMTTGFRGGGIDGPGFGIAISADDKVWATSLAGKNISVFDRRTGQPLSPDTGYDFDGQLGSMQGIIVTPNGDVWALDNGNSQIVYIPEGDASNGRILGRTVDGKPEQGTLQVKAPFHLAIDQQDRIWITNSGSDTVTRFPASVPGKAEQFKVGIAPRAIAIDSRGNAWVANTVGHPGTAEKLSLIKAKLEAKAESLAGSMSKADEEASAWIGLFDVLSEYPGGDVSLIRADGTVLPPFDANKSLVGPWGVAIDGDDNVWIANSTGRAITQLCGVRTEACPPGLKTGDPISPPGGYIGGLQIITDVEIDPAGNVWVANNWNRPDQGFKKVPEEALSTRFGGNGAVVFFGLAKPVRTPLIGPVEPW